MPHLLKLGPVVLEQASTHVYLRMTDEGQSGPPVFATQDEAGIREVIGADEAATFTCEPALQAAAAALGLAVRAPPRPALLARAAIAGFMVWGQRGLASLGSDLALLFLQAASEFWAARPWRFWDDHQPFDVRCSGALGEAFEGSLFGSAELGFGLALYRDRGSLKDLVCLQQAGHYDAAQKLPAIGVMLDDKPAYAVEALEAAGWAPRIPLPIRSGEAGPAAPTRAEGLALIGALRAVSALSPGALYVEREVSARDATVQVKVTAPPARLRN